MLGTERAIGRYRSGWCARPISIGAIEGKWTIPSSSKCTGRFRPFQAFRSTVLRVLAVKLFLLKENQ